MTILLTLLGVYIVIGLIFVGLFVTFNKTEIAEEERLHGLSLFLAGGFVFFTWPGGVVWMIRSYGKDREARAKDAS
jgi:hypothetical protein